MLFKYVFSTIYSSLQTNSHTHTQDDDNNSGYDVDDANTKRKS
jgi:hypothetical protein